MAKSKMAETVATSVVAAVAMARSAGALLHSHPTHPLRAGAGTGAGAGARSARPGAEDGRERDPARDRQRAGQVGRGRRADRAGEIPATGWRDIATRVVKEVKADNVALLSAGVAFYALLSLFPALVATVSIYGLMADPSEVTRQLESLTRTLPREAGNLVVDQVRTIASSDDGQLGATAAIGIVTALWSASSGMKWLLTALSLVYDEEEDRKFVRLRGTALALTFAAAVALVVSLGLIAATPALARHVGLGATGSTIATILRWPLLGALVIAGLAVIYRYGPDRDTAKWRWVSWGSVVGTAIWLLASIGFSLYASVAGNFNESYGSIGGVVVLMLWLYLTIFSILLGAEINAEMEHQTAKDTTTGPDRPLGARDATMADEVGEPAPSR